jgi:hypothetical protein
VDVGEAAPVEQTGIGDRAAQRVAVAADVLGQRVHHQSGARGLGVEQGRRAHGVVHHVENAPRAAQRADAGQVGHLRTRVGDGFQKHEARLGSQRSLHMCRIGDVHFVERDAVQRQGVEQACGVAEQVAAGHHMVSRAQQRQQRVADGSHAAGETDGAHALLQQCDLVFERSRGRVAGAAIGETGLGALESGRQVARIGIAEGH